MLGILFGLSSRLAMQYVQFCHDLRGQPMGVRSPQTDEQCEQVARLVAQVHTRRHREREERMLKEAAALQAATAATASAAKSAQLDTSTSTSTSTSSTNRMLEQKSDAGDSTQRRLTPPG